MPRVDPAEYLSLTLQVAPFVRGFPLHDVWLVELQGSSGCTLQDLRNLMTAEGRRSLPLPVRGLFFLRSLLGRIFRLDSKPDKELERTLIEGVPAELAGASLLPPGTPQGPFQTLYILPDEAAYQALNATVHAILSVAIARSNSGHRFFWATYVKPVGRITAVYMRLIDPFRHGVVYPGLESWLKRAWLNRAK
ncbi:MAG: DUF2867 domain-containing protein [Acidobacteriota bacterium]|nr:DUF2867 domain-containing protein [Acidobacteriota bacterium]MDH3785111.1 DUF2867 domain-containing protein [Acidobacteriota bacterium]